MTLGGNQTTAEVTVRSGGTLALSNRTLTIGTNNIENAGSITGSTGEISKTSGTFTNTATGTVAISGAAAFVMGTGNFINDNTAASINFGSSPIAMSGTVAGQTLGGFTTTGLFSCTKAMGDLTLTGDLNASGLSKSGLSTLNMGSGTHTFSTAVITLTAGTVNGETSTINVNFTSTTAWNGTASVFAAHHKVILSGTGSKTITGTVTVNTIEIKDRPELNLGAAAILNVTGP